MQAWYTSEAAFQLVEYMVIVLTFAQYSILVKKKLTND